MKNEDKRLVMKNVTLDGTKYDLVNIPIDLIMEAEENHDYICEMYHEYPEFKSWLDDIIVDTVRDNDD